MKILEVITSLLMGGAETLVTELITSLRHKGYEVDIVLFNGVDTPLKRRLKQCDCKIYDFSSRACYYNPAYIFKLAKLMKKYDVVHTHNSSPQLFAALASLICNKKLITTEHSTTNRKRNHLLYRLIDRWMYGRYSYIVCISDVAKNILQKYLGSTTAKLVTINNGVDIEYFHTALPAESLKAESRKIKVVMVASFSKAKDQDTLIRAMALLSKDSYELWLVGDGNRKKNLLCLAEELNCSVNVKFLGIRTDVASVLKAADIVVMSSHWEGLSLSSIEGMSVEKPFVASEVAGLKEVTEGYGILFPHENYRELARIISKLSNDKEYYKRVAHACYERAKCFDVSQTVLSYTNIYNSLVKS